MFGKLILLILFCFTINYTIEAQNKSNRGKEFWLAYGFDYTFFNELPVNSQELAIYISTEQAATVTVTITNTGYSQTLNIPANTVDASIIIPKTGANDARTLTDGLQNRGIHIVSNVPVAAYAHVYANQVSGATMLMPVETYGYYYNSINYYQTTSQSSPNDWYSWFYTIASEDNTRLEITPSDTTKNGWLPGTTYVVNLNKGESYHVFGKAVFDGTPAKASKDMTGSKIVSVVGADGNCHPVATFSGSGGIRLCRGDGGEFMQQQVFPAQAWGTRYLTYHTINNGNTDILETNRNYYRICVADPTTIVKKNGMVMSGLIKNFYYEYMDSTGGDYIEANKPIMVAQYMVNKNQCWNFPTTSPGPPSYGDPEMFFISPIEQGQKSVLFYVSRKSTIDYVYANIHIPTAALSSLLVDGAAVSPSQIVTHPNLPTHSVAVVRFVGAAAQHTVTADSIFTGTAYGLGNYESYGYNFGTNINNLNYYSAIKNTNSAIGNIDSFTCPKTPLRLFVKIGNPAATIRWKLSQVTGILPNTDSIIINPIPFGTEIINGRIYYIYTLAQDFSFATAGNYTIPISYTASALTTCSQTEDVFINITVKPGPQANFSFTNPVCLKDSVYFTGTSLSTGFTLNNYTWNFDDATTASTINTIKKFATAGSQNVRYRIFADNGCVGDTTKQINISPSPTSKFGLITSTCVGDSILFTDTSTIATGNIAQWKWHMGNGTIFNNTSNATVKYAYSIAGNFTPYLVTTSNIGCLSDTFFKPIIVYPKPISNFSTTNNICLGDSILITPNATISSGNITQWIWTLPPSGPALGINGNPFYYKPIVSGNPTITLQNVSNQGCKSDSFSVPVFISAKPIATITSFNGKPCLDSTFTFISSVAPVIGTSINWHWTFGDGAVANITTTNSATHNYSLIGTNIIVKHVVSIAGCKSDTTFVTIPNIFAPPMASYNFTPSTLCVATPITFNSPINANIAQYIWNFGSGPIIQNPPIAKTFTNSGNFPISLQTISTQGCPSVIFTNNLSINALPILNAGPDKLINPGSNTILDATLTNPANFNIVWFPATNLNNANILNPLAAPSITTTYIIKAVNNTTQCEATDSMILAVFTKLFFPNAFTPNADGKNDTWKIPGLAFYPDALVYIYNRWGKLLYQTNNYNTKPWDGKFNGLIQPSGSYAYIIKNIGTNKSTETGTVTIIK